MVSELLTQGAANDVKGIMRRLGAGQLGNKENDGKNERQKSSVSIFSDNTKMSEGMKNKNVRSLLIGSHAKAGCGANLF